jgi:hypothetical protein
MARIHEDHTLLTTRFLHVGLFVTQALFSNKNAVVGLCCSSLVEFLVLLWRRPRFTLPGLHPSAGGRGISKPNHGYGLKAAGTSYRAG